VIPHEQKGRERKPASGFISQEPGEGDSRVFLGDLTGEEISKTERRKRARRRGGGGYYGFNLPVGGREERGQEVEEIPWGQMKIGGDIT